MRMELTIKVEDNNNTNATDSSSQIRSVLELELYQKKIVQHKSNVPAENYRVRAHFSMGDDGVVKAT